MAPVLRKCPTLVEAEREYRSRGVVFIGASLDGRKTRRNVPEFVKTYQISFPIWVGATGDDLAALDMGVVVPSTAFTDSDGRIAARVQGAIHREELKERLEGLLGERSTAAPQLLLRHPGGD